MKWDLRSSARFDRPFDRRQLGLGLTLRLARPADPEASDRLLTTMLFTDIVGSTNTAERVGDTAWRELLARHNSAVRRELDRYADARSARQGTDS